MNTGKLVFAQAMSHLPHLSLLRRLLRWRALRGRSGQHGLYPGCDDHRPVPVGLFRSAESNLRFQRCYSRESDRANGSIVYQVLLRHVGEHGQVTDMDRRAGLCARRHPQETAESFRLVPRNPTNPQTSLVRANPVGSATCTQPTFSRSTGKSHQLILFN